jgi:hypothetical protein
MSNPKDLGWLRRKSHSRTGGCLKLKPIWRAKLLKSRFCHAYIGFRSIPWSNS